MRNSFHGSMIGRGLGEADVTVSLATSALVSITPAATAFSAWAFAVAGSTLASLIATRNLSVLAKVIHLLTSPP